MTAAKKVLKDYRIPLLTVVLFIFMSLSKECFLTKANIFAIVDSITAYGIVAIGFTFVMLAGQLDISFGSTMALTSCVFMILLPKIGFVGSVVVVMLLGCL